MKRIIKNMVKRLIISFLSLLCAKSFSQSDSIPGITEILVEKSKITKVRASPPKKVTFDWKYNLKSLVSGIDIPSGAIYGITQDKKGNVWIAHFGGGLSCYNGKEVRRYGAKEGLEDTRIMKLQIDSNQNLWMVTPDTGVIFYDGHTFTNIRSDSTFLNDLMAGVFVDELGSIWFSKANGGLVNYNGKRFKIMDDIPWFSENVISTVDIDNAGTYWFGSITDGSVMEWRNGEFTEHFLDSSLVNRGLIYSSIKDTAGVIWYSILGDENRLFTNNEGVFRTIELPLKHQLRKVLSIPFWDMQFDSKGNLWLATFNDGVLCYDGTNITEYTTQNGLINNGCLSVKEDFDGNIWMGTEKGVSVLTRDRFRSNDLVVTEIAEDSNGMLWMSSSQGLYSVDGESFSKYSMEKANNQLASNSVLVTANNNVVFVTEQEFGIYNRSENEYIFYGKETGWPTTGGNRLSKTKDGDIWICDVSGVCRFNYEKFIFYDSPFLNIEEKTNAQALRVFEDNAGGIWIGKYNTQPIRFNANEKQFFGKKEGLNNISVIDIKEDRKGNIWLSTFGGGINIYDGENFDQISTKNGLKEDVVTSMSVDGDGNMWCTTQSWLVNILPKNIVYKGLNDSSKYLKYNLKYFGVDAGFKPTDFSTGTVFIDKNNAIWLGGEDRLIHFEPSKTEISLTKNQITSLSLFNKDMDWRKQDSLKGAEYKGVNKWYGLPKQLELSYELNSLTFSFVGITTHQPQKVRYRWKLEGFNEDWSGITEKSSAYYTNLPHGEYVFKVISANADGVWNEDAATFSFTITPPWWHEWWFRFLSIFAIILVIVAINKVRLKAIREKNKLLEEEVKKRTIELKGRTAELTNKKEELEKKNNTLNHTIEELETTQKLLVESEKMAVLGQLTAAVAHELNTPLAAIKSCSSQIEVALGSILEEYTEVLKILDESEIDLFQQLINERSSFNTYYSTREERKLRKELAERLKEAEIMEAEKVSIVLSDIHLYDFDILTYSPILNHKESKLIINVLSKIITLYKSEGIISTAIEKSTKIVFSLKSYSRFDKHNKLEEVDIVENIETVLILYGNLLKGKIELQREFEAVEKIIAYPDELSQVWSNLIQNAIHAMKGKGKLKISLRDIGDQLEIKFEDGGQGIAKEHISEVFKPFFTTKEQGEGSGLGLNIVEKIIIKHKGKVSVSSKKGETIFTVLLRKKLSENQMLEQQ